MTGDRFDRVNINDAVRSPTCAHGGFGTIEFARLLDHDDVDGECNFVDLAVVPPGASIGRHRHGPDEEEYYLVLDGSGTMRRDGAEFRVRAGDLIRNAPRGEHALDNDGDTPIRLFVFEVRVTPAAAAP